MTRIVPLAQARSLPVYRRPLTLLFLMAIAMPLSFATWSALLNNFVVEAAQFDGSDIGWLHTVREIPGFLAVGVIFVIMFMREQTLAMISLAMLGIATAMTAWFPTMGGILFITLFSSIGFHYYETVNQSLQLQWLRKDRAPQMLGLLVAAASGATLVAYGVIVLTWRAYDLSYNFVYMVSGGLTLAIVAYCVLMMPHFEAPDPQTKKFVLRRRYWLYYALQFMSGARRQIFVVFAAFMMVERFGLGVDQITRLMLVTLVANMVLAPILGRAVHRFGERNAMAFEYIGLITVFALYGGIYWFGWGAVLGGVLYIANNIFFALALALKTYFQKIADPGDIAPTAAVAFTINHIAAVFLPALLGYLWLLSPGVVFALAACMAAISLALALMIPRHPEPGNETILSRGLPSPAR
ncbi:MFS transporter [Marivita sp. GX14005]|uniref:MFS transporter n=1 Tax=Marivita sp. GX14005 TaxID=2942276 RepID=UPI002019CD55|nr:MFS transporter [Marivita sp. GX14005]MCL3880990.1 MFS transporter [Marivita sp. GX14005]